MASKGLQDLKQQVEGAAQEAVTAAGAAAQQVVDQTTEAGQKAMDQVAKSTQETIDKTANQASETFSGFGKKFGLLKWQKGDEGDFLPGPELYQALSRPSH